MHVRLALTALLALAQEPALPELNRRIVELVTAQQGRKVGRGECWDLAAYALNGASAHWDGAYDLGRLIDPGKEHILPGDILQFEGVVMEHRTANGMERYSFMKHTAVVIAVEEPGKVRIAHQNFGTAGRKVSTLDLQLADLVEGELLFYRPKAE
ncbi:MAG: CHAP domain-containing protein [Flavobacteriales bacterium]|nr:CHAP domain-containing protein [Flavobacteriales bacterium]